MPEEYFDIVDENNNPIGERRLRSEAHTLGLWHRTVHIFLFRKNSDIYEFLVHLRSKNKDLNPGKWDTRFGGHLKAGETLDDAFLSELQDEIGFVPDRKDVIEGEIYKRDRGSNKEFTKVYFVRFSGTESDLRFNDGEVDEVRWMTEHKIINLMKKDPQAWSASLGGFETLLLFLKSKVA